MMTLRLALLSTLNAVAIVAGAGSASAGPQDQGVATLASGEDAQIRTPTGRTADRDGEPEDAGIGVPFGAFRLFPELSMAVAYDDNIFTAQTDPRSSTILAIEPALSARSTWSRHTANFSLAFPVRRFSESEDLNSNELEASADGRIVLDERNSINGRFLFGDRAEPLSETPGPATLSEPVDYTVTSGSAEFVTVQTFARFALGGEVNVLDFSDARSMNTIIDQDDRDHSVYRVTGRVDLERSPRTAVFASLAGSRRDYDADLLAAVPERDASGYEVLTGVNFTFSSILRGELGVGYFNEDYEVAAAESASGLAVRSEITWSPDELIVVSITGAREPESAGAPGAAGLVANAVALSVNYAATRSLDMGLRLDRTAASYEGIDREDTLWSANFSGGYRLTPSTSIVVEAGRQEQTSRGVNPGRRYDVNRFQVALNLRI